MNRYERNIAMPTPIIMPRQGQSVESCILVQWKVNKGDQVKTGDPVAEIETDKAVFEVESPADGTILDLFFEVGADIPVLTNIAAVGEEGEDASALQPEENGTTVEETVSEKQETDTAEDRPSETHPAPKAQQSPPPSPSSTSASPRARRRAEREGVDLQSISGTGPGRRIIERDVTAAANQRGRVSPVARDMAASGAQTMPETGSGPAGMLLSSDIKKAGTSTAPMEIPVKGVRKIIAERMKASLSSTAQLTLNRSFDASAIQSFRNKVKKHGESFGMQSVTINDLVVYASVRTLLRHPSLNAHFKGDRIIQFPGVNIGIAVDTPRGLMVPVVHDAQLLNPAELSRRIRPLARSCIDGNIQPDLLSGGTFTITNLGSLGIESFTPVLNAPEVAILGIGGLHLKPVDGPNGVEHVQTINLSLTIDHQAVDGAPGARFLQDLALALENIELLLSEDILK